MSDKNISTTTKVATVAGILSMEEKEVRKKELYRFVADWYGTPYRYGGCDKKGTDCSCFVSMLYASVYNKKLARTADAMEEACDRVKESHLREGDLVFFKIKSKKVSHVGVYLRNHKFVHASTSRGVVINDMNEAYYKKYFSGFGRTK